MDSPSDEPLAQAGDVIRAKWLMDGAATLEQAAEQLEETARWLRALHARGWTLEGPIEDDYGILIDPQGRGMEADVAESENGLP